MKKQHQFLSNGVPVTGASASTAVTLRRESDGYVFDFNDSTFKVSGWSSPTTPMSEVNASILPGLYEFTQSHAGWQDDTYQVFAVYSGTPAQYANGESVIKNGDIIEQSIYTLAGTLASASSVATIDSVVDAIKVKTDVIPADPATITALGTLATASALTTVDTVVDAIKLKTDALPADPASETTVNTRLASTDYVAADNVGIAAIQAKTDNLPADPVSATALGSLATASALTTVDTVVDAIKLKTDTIPSDPATITALGSLATASALATVDEIVDAIKLKTDNLPSDPASETTVLTRLAADDYEATDISGITTHINAIKVKTDTLPASPANEVTVLSVSGKIDTVDTVVDGIAAKIPSDPATITKQDAILSGLSGLATTSAVATIDAVVDAIKLKTDTIPGDPATITALGSLATASELATVNGIVDAIKLKTDNLPVDPASTTQVTAVESKIDTIDGLVDSIKLKTDSLPSDPASESTVLTMLTDAEAETRFDTIDDTLYNLTHSPEGEPVSRIIPPPVASGMCRLFEFVYTVPGNEAVESVTATCRILGPYDSGQQLHTIETVQGTYGVDEDHPELGPFLYFDVVWGARAAIEIAEANVNKTVIVPRETSARIAKLRGV